MESNRFLCVVFRESPNRLGEDLYKEKFLRESKIDTQPNGGLVAVRRHFGGNTAVVRPVPIPNTAVKHCMADGSGCIASARVGSRQSFQQNVAWSFRREQLSSLFPGFIW